MAPKPHDPRPPLVAVEAKLRATQNIFCNGTKTGDERLALSQRIWDLRQEKNRLMGGQDGAAATDAA